MQKIVIIGGGLGGLTAGALLSKKGYPVVLLEQHNIVGGSATTFRRKGGFTLEVGLHEMDAVHDNQSTKELFDMLGVYENIEFVRPDEFFRVTAEGFDFTMPDRREKALSALKERYPEDASGLDRYFNLIDSLASDIERVQHARWWELMLFPLLFSNLLKYQKLSVLDVLDELLENEELKLILNANIGYYHTAPDTFSILYHSFAQSHYYRYGGWYIKGGSQKLSDYLASIIRENNGTIHTGSEAVSIATEGKTATSVTWKKRGKDNLEKADIIISNISPAQTCALADLAYQETKKTASSLLSVYLGFSKNLKSVYGKQAYSRFFFPGVKTVDDYKALLEKDITERGFVFVDYSQIDAGLCSPDKSVASICTTDFIAPYLEMTENEYKQKKQDITNAYLKVLEEHYPGISDLVEISEVGTPRSIQRYLRTPEGTAYGFAPSAEQFFRKPQVQSPLLNNVFFTGAWVIGGGFSPAVNSGNMCYKAIVKGI